MPPLSNYVAAAKGQRVLHMTEADADGDRLIEEASIAALSYEELERLFPEELIRIILSTSLPGLAPIDREQLEMMDMVTLRRLANLARFVCCKRTGRLAVQQASQAPGN